MTGSDHYKDLKAGSQLARETASEYRQEALSYESIGNAEKAEECMRKAQECLTRAEWYEGRISMFYGERDD